MQTSSEEIKAEQEVAVLRLTFHFNPSGSSELSAGMTYPFFYQSFVKVK